MSGDEFFISHKEVEKLGRNFESMAYDLEQYAKVFQGATGAETIHEPEEATAACIELSEHMVTALGDLYRHLDGMGGKLMAAAHNTEASDEALAQAFADRDGR